MQIRRIRFDKQDFSFEKKNNSLFSHKVKISHDARKS